MHRKSWTRRSGIRGDEDPWTSGLIRRSWPALRTDRSSGSCAGHRVAVRLRAPGTVAILCAAGLQANNWSDIPPEHLYRIVRALRLVGLEPEARMIAAEAVSRA